METLGTLVDKLIVIKLKQCHSEDPGKLAALENQSVQMRQELDDYIARATNGTMPIALMTNPVNKVYHSGIILPEYHGELGELISSLSYINCEVWHSVDKSYHAEQYSREELASLVKNLAILNLQRNKCIEAIDNQFKGQVML